MLRRVHSIILSNGTRFIALLTTILALSIQNGQVSADTEAATIQSKSKLEQQQQQQQEQLSHPALLVDTKYWTKNTEFGERINWHNLIKPCTLMERIKMSEQTVVSMGSALDGILESGALESNIKDLNLANNGLLLLEEDTLDDPLDPFYVKYLNDSGDCLDSEMFSTSEQQSSETSGERLFQFGPNSDDMSWFNPDNWASAWIFDEVVDWIPDSHRIPCSEDVVIFGSRKWSLGATLESEERSDVLSFKVNFRPSLYGPDESGSWNYSINNLRVSKLKIGQQTYSQKELDQLLSSNAYEDTLFHFNDTLSLLRQEPSYDTDKYQTLLTIDESSIHPTSSIETCLDEAGCLCGNEEANVMKAICSFNEPLEDSDYPCLDPIYSTGYCNRVCATSLLINMDPVKFSEHFVSNAIHRLTMEEEEKSQKYFTDNVFVGARRTSSNKYEITFRLVPSDASDSYDAILGREQEFAHLVYDTLSHGATRSFYGIKSVTMRSSNNWRRDNQQAIFVCSLLVLLVTALIAVIYEDGQDAASKNCTLGTVWLFGLPVWLIDVSVSAFARAKGTTSYPSEVPDRDNTDESDERSFGSTSNIPLLKLDAELHSTFSNDL